jgi:hypothetical protein
LRDWLATDWAFDHVVFMIGREDARQASLLAESGISPLGDVTLADGRSCRVFG